MRLLLVVFISIIACNAAWAAVYEWVDSQGIVHMTDDADKVPGKYRKIMKIREIDTRDVGTPSSLAEKPSVSVPALGQKTELYGDHDRDWWRTSFANVRNELKRLREKLPEKKEQLPQAHRDWVISMGKTPGKGQSTSNPASYITDSSLSTSGQHRVAYYTLKDEIEKDDARIKELEQQLASLESLANRFDVPADWRY